jgi:hypothetical protein
MIADISRISFVGILACPPCGLLLMKRAMI